MDITIAAVGKIKADTPEFLLCSHYLKLAHWPCKVIEVQEKRDLPVIERKKSEAELLLKAVSGADVLIALDEHGKEFSSLAFASEMQKWEMRGKIAFVIGGADGLDEAVRVKASVVMSMGKMTMPHFLARVLLAEQIYRAHTIISGHPYHRG